MLRNSVVLRQVYSRDRNVITMRCNVCWGTVRLLLGRKVVDGSVLVHNILWDCMRALQCCWDVLHMCPITVDLQGVLWHNNGLHEKN